MPSATLSRLDRCDWCGVRVGHSPLCVEVTGRFLMADDPRDVLDEAVIDDVVSRAIDVRTHGSYSL